MAGSTGHPAVAAPIPEAVASDPDAVEYPEGHWVAQSVWHGVSVRLATDALVHHFRGREDVLVAMELVVYYERGDEIAKLQPDVQVVFGVGRGWNRSTFKVWQEGKAPDFVLEVASPSTANNDARDKAIEYIDLGVREYWRLDPEGTMMSAPLEGYRAKWGRYERVESVQRTGGVEYLRSSVLGLDLRTERREGATVLMIRDPRTGEEFAGGLEESDRQRRLAENRVRAAEDRAIAAEDRASAAETRNRLLEQRLRDLTAQPGPMDRDS
ncbi:MAG: Uma2 family endonuclease [Bryobacterales bacterium]|nr:Uma2 family endonuclease [Bryobacterales bacterium]